jgi:hypothetical protein
MTRSSVIDRQHPGVILRECSPDEHFVVCAWAHERVRG